MGKLEIALERNRTCRRVAANVAWVRQCQGRGMFLFISTSTTPRRVAIESYKYELEQYFMSISKTKSSQHKVELVNDSGWPGKEVTQSAPGLTK